MSAQSIYNKGGWPVGWLSADVIYDLAGDARAFVIDGSICSFEGQRLGAFGDGYLRDPSGDAVGYVEGAKGGPALPEIQATEPAPEFNEEPERPSTSGAASSSASSSASRASENDRWSELAFNTLMRGWPPGVTEIHG